MLMRGNVRKLPPRNFPVNYCCLVCFSEKLEDLWFVFDIMGVNSGYEIKKKIYIVIDVI